MNKVVQTPDQHYYLSELLGYDYILVYRAGKTNKVANALSRYNYAYAAFLSTNDSFFLLLEDFMPCNFFFPIYLPYITKWNINKFSIRL